MKKTLTALLALSIGLTAAPAALAHTPTVKGKAHTTSELNRRQLAKARDLPYTAPAPRIQTSYYTADPQVVTVLAPPHNNSDAKGPDTNPQSTGTPSIDTPYAVLVKVKSN